MYKELCHPIHRAKPHRQHSQGLDIKYRKKKQMTKMVSTALYLQMQQNLPIYRITLFSCTHIFMIQNKKKHVLTLRTLPGLRQQRF